MKEYVLSGACLLLLVLSAFSQKPRRLVELKYKGCSFSDDDIPDSISVSDPSDAAKSYVRKICEVAVIDNNFWVEESDVPSAMATTDDQHHRVIYYSEYFFSNLKSETYKIAILAHEIGHHLNFNVFETDQPRSREDELTADKFAGSVLCRLGLKMDDAKQLLDIECPVVAKGFYPDREARKKAFQAGFDEVIGRSIPGEGNDFTIRIKSLIYKVEFNSSLGDVLGFEYGPQQANAFRYEQLPTATECAGPQIKYYTLPLKNSKLNSEIYSYLANIGLKDKVDDASYIVYYFMDNKLARIGLRIFPLSDDFQQIFFKSLSQDMIRYPLRYQTEINGIHFISGSSFTDLKSTEIFIMNETGYKFCIHDWWHY